MTPAESEYLTEAWSRGDKFEDIRRKLDVSAYTLKKWRRKLGLPTRATAPPSAPADFVRELTVEHMSVRALCRKYKTSTPTIERWAQEHEINFDDYRRPPNTKHAVPADWHTVAPTMTVKQLQAYYGISESLVRRIAKDTRVKFVGRRSRYIAVAPGPDLSSLDKAAHYLRKFFNNVHRCDIKLYSEYDPERRDLTWGSVRGVPNKGVGYYYVDSVGIVANTDVLALAQSKGWRDA